MLVFFVFFDVFSCILMFLKFLVFLVFMVCVFLFRVFYIIYLRQFPLFSNDLEFRRFDLTINSLISIVRFTRFRCFTFQPICVFFFYLFATT